MNKLLTKIQRKEKSRHTLKWLCSFGALLKFSAAIYLYNMRLNFFTNHQEGNTYVAPIELIATEKLNIYFMLFFLSGFFSMLIAISSWIGSYERLALIELLKENT